MYSLHYKWPLKCLIGGYNPFDQSEKREVQSAILHRKAFHTRWAGRTAHAHTELNKLLGDAESAGPVALEVIQFRISFPRGKPRWNESLKVSSFPISWLWSPGLYSASPFCVPHSSLSPRLIARMSLCPGAPEDRGSLRWELLRYVHRFFKFPSRLVLK